MLSGGTIGEVRDVDGIGQLSSDSANRLLTALRLQRNMNVPIILAGGRVFDTTADEAEIAQRAALALGTDYNMIVLENMSRNTVENARFVKKICS